jgi:hypothetical protein
MDAAKTNQPEIERLELSLTEAADSVRRLVKLLADEMSQHNSRTSLDNRNHWSTVHINSWQLEQALRGINGLLLVAKGSAGFDGVVKCKQCGVLSVKREG